MKEKLTLTLSRHQAKVLCLLVDFANQFFILPPNQPLYNIPTVDVESDMVKAESSLLQKEILSQFEMQDMA